MKRFLLALIALESHFKHHTDNRTGTADVGWETNLTAGVTCIHDVFLIEHVLAEGTDFIINLAWLETVACGEVEQSVGILGELRLVALLEEYLRLP